MLTLLLARHVYYHRITLAIIETSQPPAPAPGACMKAREYTGSCISLAHSRTRARKRVLRAGVYSYMHPAASGINHIIGAFL